MKKIVTFFFFFLGWGVILESVKEQKKDRIKSQQEFSVFFI